MNDIKVIPLIGGGFTIVSEEDFSEVCHLPWKKNAGGYAFIFVRDGEKWKQVYLHRYINKTPKGVITDHRNRCRFDNRRCNLRNATASLNHANADKFKGAYSSKWKGVSWHVRAKKWIAHIRVNDKLIHLGYFHSEREAADAYNRAVVKYFDPDCAMNSI